LKQYGNFVEEINIFGFAWNQATIPRMFSSLLTYDTDLMRPCAE